MHKMNILINTTPLAWTIIQIDRKLFSRTGLLLEAGADAAYGVNYNIDQYVVGQCSTADVGVSWDCELTVTFIHCTRMSY